MFFVRFPLDSRCDLGIMNPIYRAFLLQSPERMGTVMMNRKLSLCSASILSTAAHIFDAWRFWYWSFSAPVPI